METFNECTLICLNYFLFCFNDFVPEAQTRSDLGYYFVAVSLTNMAVHLVFIVAFNLVTFRNYLRSKGKCLPK